MAGKVIDAGEAGEWLHRIQLARAMLDWRAVIRRIWWTKSSLRCLYRRYAEDVGAGVGEAGDVGEAVKVAG